MDVVVSGVAVRLADHPHSAGLSDKVTRRLIEQAALVAEGATEVESLNR